MSISTKQGHTYDYIRRNNQTKNTSPAMAIQFPRPKPHWEYMRWGLQGYEGTETLKRQTARTCCSSGMGYCESAYLHGKFTLYAKPSRPKVVIRDFKVFIRDRYFNKEMNSFFFKFFILEIICSCQDSFEN